MSYGELRPCMKQSCSPNSSLFCVFFIVIGEDTEFKKGDPVRLKGLQEERRIKLWHTGKCKM
jgi:hypothetical protein